MDRRSHDFIATWNEINNGTMEVNPERPIVWSAGYIWVDERFRRAGFARLLCEKCAAYLGADLETLGWAWPFSNAGKAFLRRLFPNQVKIT